MHKEKLSPEVPSFVRTHFFALTPFLSPSLYGYNYNVLFFHFLYIRYFLTSLFIQPSEINKREEFPQVPQVLACLQSIEILTSPLSSFLDSFALVHPLKGIQDLLHFNGRPSPIYEMKKVCSIRKKTNNRNLNQVDCMRHIKVYEK